MPALDRCFFRCSRVTYSNCSRCLARGERGRGEKPPVRGGFPLSPGRGFPRALSVPPAAVGAPGRQLRPGSGRARTGQPVRGMPVRRGRQHPAAGTGGFKAVPAPCLPEAPYGPSCTSAALFPHQLGPEGELREQQPPPAPQPPGAPALGITRGLRG